MKCSTLLLISLLFFCSTKTENSFPFIAGDNFRSLANHIYDERKRTFDPARVKNRDIVFVKTDFLPKFFKMHHPRIVHPYILITHNSDNAAPGNFLPYLDDPKIIAWFGQNPDNTHPKFHPIPIGIMCQLWQPNCMQSIKAVQENALLLHRKQFDSSACAYMNITISSNNAVRKKVYDTFCNQPWCFKASKKKLFNYLQEMARFCFVISPEGNGLDCHRTWEALYVGCIPIVKSNSLDALYEGLPVLIVDQWEDVTEDFLREQFKIIQSKQYTFEKLNVYYWLDQILIYKYGKNYEA